MEFNLIFIMNGNLIILNKFVNNINNNHFRVWIHCVMKIVHIAINNNVKFVRLAIHYIIILVFLFVEIQL